MRLLLPPLLLLLISLAPPTTIRVALTAGLLPAGSAAGACSTMRWRSNLAPICCPAMADAMVKMMAYLGMMTALRIMAMKGMVAWTAKNQPTENLSVCSRVMPQGTLSTAVVRPIARNLTGRAWGRSWRIGLVAARKALALSMGSGQVMCPCLSKTSPAKGPSHLRRGQAPAVCAEPDSGPTLPAPGLEKLPPLGTLPPLNADGPLVEADVLPAVPGARFVGPFALLLGGPESSFRGWGLGLGLKKLWKSGKPAPRDSEASGSGAADRGGEAGGLQPLARKVASDTASTEAEELSA